jgi:hypothetical protein
MPSLSLPTEAFEAENVQGYLHKAAGGVTEGMVLTHGAGGNCETPLLIAISEAFQNTGVTVLRCNLPRGLSRLGMCSSPTGISVRAKRGLLLLLNYFAAHMDDWDPKITKADSSGHPTAGRNLRDGAMEPSDRRRRRVPP